MVPCYKRPEYTEKCIKALGQDGCEYVLYQHPGDKGLRSAVLDFFENHKHFDFLAKVDNDCLVPKGWLDDMLDIMVLGGLDILCPNVYPSNAAYKHGADREEELGYRPTKTAGGVWVMRSSLIADMYFEDHPSLGGLTGAVPLMRQIVNEKDPKMGWTTKVCFADLGHWSGKHPDHIKSVEHKEYSLEVGRQVAW